MPLFDGCFWSLNVRELVQTYSWIVVTPQLRRTGQQVKKDQRPSSNLAVTSTSDLRISCNMLVAAEPVTTTPHTVLASRRGSYRMRLNFHGTKLSRIANLLNIRGCWERIDMVDHLVLRKLFNQLLSNEASSVFVLLIQYNGDSGARGTSASIFYDFATRARNIRGLNYSRMVFRTEKFQRIR